MFRLRHARQTDAPRPASPEGTRRRRAAARRALATLWLGASVLLAPVAQALGAELVMFEALGCGWCEAWNADVGAVYDRTEEGRIAPLRRVDIHARRPADLVSLTDIIYTPTFVLLEGGVEVGRILGYPGEGHFWGLLGELLARLPRAPRS